MQVEAMLLDNPVMNEASDDGEVGHAPDTNFDHDDHSDARSDITSDTAFGNGSETAVEDESETDGDSDDQTVVDIEFEPDVEGIAVDVDFGAAEDVGYEVTEYAGSEAAEDVEYEAAEVAPEAEVEELAGGDMEEVHGVEAHEEHALVDDETAPMTLSEVLAGLAGIDSATDGDDHVVRQFAEGSEAGDAEEETPTEIDFSDIPNARSFDHSFSTPPSSQSSSGSRKSTLDPRDLDNFEPPEMDLRALAPQGSFHFDAMKFQLPSARGLARTASGKPDVWNPDPLSLSREPSLNQDWFNDPSPV